MGILFFIAIIFICVAYPFFLLLTIWDFPLFVIIICFMWIIGTITYVTYNKKDKLREYITPVIILDLVFTLIYIGSSGDTWIGNSKDDAFMVLATPSLCVPAMVYVGSKLHIVRTRNIAQKEDQLRTDIRTIIENKRMEIYKFNSKYNNCKLLDKTTKEIVGLVSACAGNKTLEELYMNMSDRVFDNNLNKLKNIIPMEMMPQNNNEFIAYADNQQTKLKEYSKILKEFQQYDYKKLKAVLKECSKN